MKFASKSDKSRVVYNHKITMSNVPLEAYEYVVNGKPALEWVMERQAVMALTAQTRMPAASEAAISITYPMAFSATKITNHTPGSVNNSPTTQYRLQSVIGKPGYEIVSSKFIVTSKSNADILSISAKPDGSSARAAVSLNPDDVKAHVEGYLQTVQIKK